MSRTAALIALLGTGCFPLLDMTGTRGFNPPTDTTAHADTADDTGIIDDTGGNHAPACTISGPADGTRAWFTDAVTLAGHADDPEDGAVPDAALWWTSDLQGSLGSGAQLTPTFTISGVHTIVLSARDSKGAGCTDTIGLEIRSPTAGITGPSDGASFEVGHHVDFHGWGDDLEDGPLTGTSLLWTSDVDGDFAVGPSPTTHQLSIGEHLITLTATDSASNTGSASIHVTITGTGGETD